MNTPEDSLLSIHKKIRKKKGSLSTSSVSNYSNSCSIYKLNKQQRKKAGISRYTYHIPYPSLSQV